MKTDFFFRIVVLIIFIYAIIAFIYGFINTIVLVLLTLAVVIIYILTQEFKFSVAENKWRFLATIGSITTAISLLINASVFIKNEKTQVDQNMISFNKIVSDSFGKLEDNFMRESDKLGYLYHDIYFASGHPLASNLAEKRDKNLEFQQALKIFYAMELVFIAGKLKEKKDLPEYRGILNLFDIYTSSPLMREYWKTLRYNFSPGFIKFIEEEFYNYRISTDLVFVS
jgi:hypothetical protein